GIDRLLGDGFTAVTDDNLRLEYRLPRGLFRDFDPGNALEIQRALSPVAPYLVRGSDPEDAWIRLRAAVDRVDAGDPGYYGVLAHTPWGLSESGEELGRIISGAPEHAPALGRFYHWTLVVGETLHGEGNCAEAGNYLERVLASGSEADAYDA